MNCCCCFGEIEFANKIVKCDQNHITCQDCVENGVKSAIGNLELFKCPSATDDGTACGIVIDESQIIKIIDPHLAHGYEKTTTHVNLKNVDGVIHCGVCDYAEFLVTTDPSIISFFCKNCNKAYCIKCKREEHSGKPCGSHIYEEAEELSRKFTIQCCVPIMKHDACNHVTCPKCNKRWCWYCKKEGWHDDRCDLYANPPEAPDARETSAKIAEKLAEEEQAQSSSKDNVRIAAEVRAKLAIEASNTQKAINTAMNDLGKFRQENIIVEHEIKSKSQTLVDLIDHGLTIVSHINATSRDNNEKIQKEMNINTNVIKMLNRVNYNKENTVYKNLVQLKAQFEAELGKLDSRIATSHNNVERYSQELSDVLKAKQSFIDQSDGYLINKTSSYDRFENQLKTISSQLSSIISLEQIVSLHTQVNEIHANVLESFESQMIEVARIISEYDEYSETVTNENTHIGNKAEAEFVKINICFSNYRRIIDPIKSKIDIELIELKMVLLKLDRTREIQEFKDAKHYSKCYDQFRLANLRLRMKPLITEYENNPDPKIYNLTDPRAIPVPDAPGDINLCIYACLTDNVRAIRRFANLSESTMLHGIDVALGYANLGAFGAMLERWGEKIIPTYNLRGIGQCIVKYNMVAFTQVLMPHLFRVEDLACLKYLQDIARRYDLKEDRTLLILYFQEAYLARKVQLHQ